MLLLPQLAQIWLPDHSAAHDEDFSRPIGEPAPKLRTPPLILFLEDLPDVLSADELFPGKRLPCGHVVSLRSIIKCCNILGDAIWTPAPHNFGCAQPECEDLLEFPTISDPRVVDGLEARLDLIEWSWEHVEPTKPERNVVSLLRDILTGIGHLSRDPEPETDAEVSRPEPSEASLKQTLVHMEIEAFGLMAENAAKSAETPVRGTQPYCSYRTPMVPGADHSQPRYPMPSPGQECDCVTPHEYTREAGSWALTPAETETETETKIGRHDDNESNDDNEKKESTEQRSRRKTVRFVAPAVVTEVRYFEPWWCDEYRDSDRYWSTGPMRRSVDLATAADDDWEITLLDGGLADGISRDSLEDGDGDSDCSTLVEEEEEEEKEVLDEKEEKADELSDENVLDEMDKADEEWSSDEEILRETEEVGELGDDCF